MSHEDTLDARRTVIPFGDVLAGRIRNLVATRDEANATIKAMLEGALAAEGIDLAHENWLAQMNTESFVFIKTTWSETSATNVVVEEACEIEN